MAGRQIRFWRPAWYSDPTPAPMGKLNGKDPSVWMRSIRWHTYEGKPQAEDDCYLAHEDMVETIITLKFAVRDTPPKRAVHSPTTIKVPA